MLKVKVFDAEDETELEDDMNEFLQTINETQLQDIKFQVAAIDDSEEIICSFSAMILFRE